MRIERRKIRILKAAIFTMAALLVFSATWNLVLLQQEPEPATDISKAQKAEATRIKMNDSILAATWEQIDGDSLLPTEIVIQLARNETGNYRSRVFLRNNNLFGIRYPQSRSMTASKGVGGYAWYNSHLESIIDLKLYLKRYGTHLVGYSENPNYKQDLEASAKAGKERKQKDHDRGH